MIATQSDPVSKCSSKPLDRPADRRMNHLAGDLDRRLQHEPAKRHPRMRHRERGRVDDRVAVQQQIEVERAICPSARAARGRAVIRFAATARASRSPTCDVSTSAAPLRNSLLRRKSANGKRQLPSSLRRPNRRPAPPPARRIAASSVAARSPKFDPSATRHVVIERRTTWRQEKRIRTGGRGECRVGFAHHCLCYLCFLLFKLYSADTGARPELYVRAQKKCGRTSPRSFCRDHDAQIVGNIALGRDHPGPRLVSPAFDPSVAPPKIVAYIDKTWAAAAYRQWSSRRKNNYCRLGAWIDNAHRTTLLATEGKLSPCMIRPQFGAAKLVGPIDSVPPVGSPPGVTHSSQRKPQQRIPQQLSTITSRIVVRLLPTARHCPSRRRCVKQLFFKNMFRGKRDLRSLKRLFRAANRRRERAATSADARARRSMKSECTSRCRIRQRAIRRAFTRPLRQAKIDAMSTDAATFAGLRVASFESRRADDMARMIASAAACRCVSPSMREVPLAHNQAAIDFANRLITGQIDVVIFLTGVGTRHLLAQIERHVDRDAVSGGGERRQVGRPRPEAARRAERSWHHADDRRARAEHLARAADRRSTSGCRWRISSSACRNTASPIAA